jgi:hypothetical protein
MAEVARVAEIDAALLVDGDVVGGIDMPLGERKMVAFFVFGLSFQIWPASMKPRLSLATWEKVMSLK